MKDPKVKSCKICHQQIDIRAQKCLYCHQKQNKISKFYVIIALTLVILMTMSWLSYQYTVREREANELENHTFMVINEFSDLLNSLKDAETGQRGFTITGDREYLEPYNESLSLVDRHLSTLRNLTSDNPNQQRRLTAIEPLIRARLSTLDEIIKLRSAKGLQSAGDRAMMGFGKKTMDSLRELVGQALSEEKELLKVRSALESKYASRVVYSLLFGGILCSIILVTLYAILWREYAKRLIVESELSVHRDLLEEQTEELTQSLDSLEEEVAERQMSEERYRALITASSYVVYRMSPDWSEMRQLHGRNFITDTEKPNCKWLEEYIHPDDQSRVKAVFSEAIRTKSIFELEHRVLRVDGSLGWTFSRAIPLQDANGKIIEWFGAASDVTERKRAEEALEKLNVELENRVVERTAELVAKNEKLKIETTERVQAVESLREKERMLIQQSRQAAMGEMIGNIAHQWRQPLNNLGLSIQQLELYYELGEFTKEFLVQSVGKSMELIQHMSKTIDDFRNFFEPEKEKVEFEVSEAIENTLSLIEDSFKNKNIGVEVVRKGDPIIYGYRNEFAQVLLNILNNASDVLTERASIDPKVTVTLSSEGDRTVVIVADNAGGIPNESISKVFDPYFTTKGPQQGTGVGLYMSKIIIEKNMGGKLTVRNIADGAEFRIEVRNGVND